MAQLTTPISQLIFDRLSLGESRVLGLVVGVRKALGRSEGIKGDLSALIKSTLQKLVAAKMVVEVDGMFSLSPDQSHRPVLER